MLKPLYLIGGATATGKTTLSRALCHRLSIDHRISTGFIREVIRDQTSEQAYPELFSSTFRTPDPVRALVIQSQLLERPVRRCIERARLEGTSLIVEGAHLNPAIYHAAPYQGFVILAAPSDLEYGERLLGASTYASRKLTRADVVRARAIDTFLQRQASIHGVPYMRYDGDVEPIVDLLLRQSATFRG